MKIKGTLILIITVLFFTASIISPVSADHKCNDGVWGMCDSAEEEVGGGAAGGDAPPPTTTTLPPPPPPEPGDWRELLGIPEEAEIIIHIPYGLEEFDLWTLYSGWNFSVVSNPNNDFKLIIFNKATGPRSMLIDIIVLVSDEGEWLFIRGWRIEKLAPPPDHIWYAPNGGDEFGNEGVSLNYVPEDWAFVLVNTTHPHIIAEEYGIRVGYRTGQPMPAGTVIATGKVP